MQVNLIRISVLICCFLSYSTFAQSVDVSQKEDVEVSGYELNGIEIDKQYLDSWGITKEEYERYDYIQNNTARGYFTPNANPLVYLGIEARTERERRKYAEKVAKLEWDNHEKTKAFMNAVQEASVGIFGRGAALDIQKGNEFEEGLTALASGKPINSNGIVNNDDAKLDGAMFNSRTLFIKTDCEPCDAQYRNLYTQLVQGSIARIEVVFSGASKVEMVRWAKKNEVSAQLNARGVIVLRKMDREESVSDYPTVRASSI